MNDATDYYVSLPPLIGTFALILIVGKQPKEISTQTIKKNYYSTGNTYNERFRVQHQANYSVLKRT